MDRKGCSPGYPRHKNERPHRPADQTHSNSSYAPIWSGRVPAWISVTDGVQVGDACLLIIRVLLETELVLRSAEPCDPLEITRAIRSRLHHQRWPVRNWFLSHIVYVTHVVNVPKQGGTATIRLCGGRIPDSRGRLQQLAFLALAQVPVSVRPSAKSADWDMQIVLNRRPACFPSWYELVLQMFAYEPWERRMIFKALGHVMPNDVQYLLD